MSKNRIKRAAAEAAGWIAALAVIIVVAAMECGALRPMAGAALGLGLELVGALALYKAGVIRPTGARPSEAGAARRGGTGGIIEQRPEGAVKHSAESRRKAGVIRVE